MIRQLIKNAFGLTEAEEDEARAAAGKPWRTGYYVAGRDWPAFNPGLTAEEAYAAVKQVWAGAEGGGTDAADCS